MTLEELETLESNLITEINALVTARKPDYKVGEHTYNWTKHLTELRKQLDWVQEMLANYPTEETTLWRPTS